MHKLKSTSIYDEIYLKSLINNSSIRINRIIEFIDFNKSDIIGDFASGSGTLAWSINNRILKYYGIDTSLDFIRFSNKQAKLYDIKNVYFKCEKISEFCSKRPHFLDKAFALDFSEHLNDSDFNKIFKSIWTSLKPNGILYMHTPNSKYFIEILKHIHFIPQTPGHIAVRNASQYKSMLTQIGFKNVQIIYLSHYLPILKKLHFMSKIPLINYFFRARIFLICQK